MRSTIKAPESMLSAFARLDDTCMSQHDREMAKGYMRKTEAMLDVIWLVGARIRAAI